MKTNIITAAFILSGCLLVWSYLAAQPGAETVTPSVKSSLLEIREPSQEDFEHCAKKAVDFFGTWSEDQAKMSIALYELIGAVDDSPVFRSMASQLAFVKSQITYGHLELISQKSVGENIIILCYAYHVDKCPIYNRFVFSRTVDQNGEPESWKCSFQFSDRIEMIIPPTL